MALEKELQTYEQKQEELMAHKGKYALIYQDQVLGVFAAYEDALQEGYKKVGTEPFLVKCIESTETVQHFTRGIEPCCT